MQQAIFQVRFTLIWILPTTRESNNGELEEIKNLFSYARFGLYPPKIFEKYMQLLGLANSDPIVVYSRGPAAGMLFAARVWWTLKVGKDAV